MESINIGFIGGGNMASSLIGGLIAGHVAAQNIWVSDQDADKLKRLQDQFAVNITPDNEEVLRQVDVVVLAVKPQVMHSVCRELANLVQDRKPLLVSIAAGIRESSLNQWLGGHVAIVRTMPNTPALVQSGATAMFANAQVNEKQKSLAESILRSVGLTLWLDREELMDSVTAVSGSGPAYFFLIMEILQQAGEDLGLNRETARLLTLQTAFGAAKMALESTVEPQELRRQVTSPGGTTEKAINTLMDGNLRELFGKAVAAAQHRSKELAEQLGE